ncbi:tumor necrosis factor receptor superfamily member 13B [Betta splendens]|uniref:Tumor necrosis factor receptor superfamily member 13B n=1 Tax=Betta splendens TaxID=158456 RepID=A0A6P7L3H9_BETSP|nr:tumor necrosis factor receptor superfamily member 13B [Betta splendens]
MSSHVEIQAWLIRVCRPRILPPLLHLARSPGLMGKKCCEGKHWDGLLKKCVECRLTCQETHMNSRCISYCKSLQCKATPGHYYDLLLKKCMRCSDICGRHPAECSQHCQTSTAPVTGGALTAEVTGVKASRDLSVTTGLEPPGIWMYPLLALCVVLVVASLSAALAVFPRRARKGASNPGAKKASAKQEAGPPRAQKDVVTNPSRPAEPSEEPNPTETCVCVHCFPDLKALGQSSDGPLRAPFTFYQQAVHKGPTPKGASLWSEDSLYTSGIEVHEEAAVG